eukprot:CAMPEP_0185760488 /NCGR_PEP_ID=MMETSP1174-20130828/19361_1 /TAXON_ID=35687 /ORGANISM="Dictyocha speculum, Strain CCMP1381" /LENGTH=191 /DNA_ID=CAMNT_0028441323 /DNA_START=215 /DNA_END=790 /DNA_ORIENTATION=+
MVVFVFPAPLLANSAIITTPSSQLSSTRRSFFVSLEHVLRRVASTTGQRGGLHATRRPATLEHVPRVCIALALHRPVSAIRMLVDGTIEGVDAPQLPRIKKHAERFLLPVVVSRNWKELGVGSQVVFVSGPGENGDVPLQGPGEDHEGHRHAGDVRMGGGDVTKNGARQDRIAASASPSLEGSVFPLTTKS